MPLIKLFRCGIYLVMAGAMGAASGLAQAQDAAAVSATTGVVVAQKSDGAVRSLAPGSMVQTGDVIITQPNSSARLKFTDGGDVSVGANSQLRIDSYSFNAATPQKDNLVMSLLKGGLRNITGLVSKRGNRDAYKLQTSTATIGIRGTEFVAALCDENCAREGAKTAPAARATDPDIVARVALLTGEAVATDKPGAVRTLKVGSPIYQGNTVETRAQSHAVLVFADEGRITLQPETRFVVERFRYAPTRPEQDSSVVRILKGGVRALTGLIGKRNPQGYQVQTTTATIGIRGTGFDAFCTGSCESGTPPQAGRKPAIEGLFVNTWQDEVTVQNSGGSQTVGVGQTVQVLSPDQPPVFLAEVPAFMRDAPGPRPDGIQIDFQQLFGAAEDTSGSGGLYVLVKDGIVVLVQGERILELDRGESAFAGFVPGQFYRLASPPPVLQLLENQLPPATSAGSLICTF